MQETSTSRHREALGAAIREARKAIETEHPPAKQRVVSKDEKPVVSQEELAGKAGLHRNYWGRVERGELNLSFASLVSIAHALDMKLSELIQAYEKHLGR